MCLLDGDVVPSVVAHGRWSDLWLSLTHPIALIGLSGQACFFLRFLVQWLVSEHHQRSVVPRVFWYFSIAGSLLVLAYGVARGDGVIVVGQIPGFIAYVRNLVLISRSGPTISTA
jgi:lipid-A-disaccharide synthase-like uncharacterized protein